MPKTEAQIAAQIDASKMLGTEGEPPPNSRAGKSVGDRDLRQAPARAKPAAKEPEADADDTHPDDQTDAAEAPDDAQEGADDQTEDGTDAAASDESDQDGDGDGIDDPELGRMPRSIRETFATLREEVADLKEQLAGRGRKDASATDDAEVGTPASAQSDKTAKQFEKVRARIKGAKDKLTANSEKWGELAKDLGLDDFLDSQSDLLDDLEGERTTRAQSEAKAKKDAQAQHQARAVEAANNFHRGLNKLARGNQSLLNKIGLGLHETLKPRTIQIRSEIMDVAIQELQKSQRAVRNKKRSAPMTEGEAIAAAIEDVTGIQVTTADRQARDRARMVRPSGGGSTSRGDEKESQEQTEKRLAKAADEFMNKQR